MSNVCVDCALTGRTDGQDDGGPRRLALLLDGSVLPAKRAHEAGVDSILDVTANVPHVFQAFVGTLDESDQALDRAALFIRQHIGG